MPIYAMQCDSCGAEQDIYRSVSEMDKDLPDCCGANMRRKICKPFVMTDIQPYQSMIDGSMITSRSQHRSHLKEHGMVELGNEAPVKQKTNDEPVGNLRKDLMETMTGYGL